MSCIGSKIMGDVFRGQWGWWEDNMPWQNGEMMLGDIKRQNVLIWRRWWGDVMKCWGDDEGHWATRRCKRMPSNAKEMSLGCWVTLKNIRDDELLLLLLWLFSNDGKGHWVVIGRWWRVPNNIGKLWGMLGKLWEMTKVEKKCWENIE
jgi:hypothetical protein